MLLAFIYVYLSGRIAVGLIQWLAPSIISSEAEEVSLEVFLHCFTNCLTLQGNV